MQFQPEKPDPSKIDLASADIIALYWLGALVAIVATLGVG
jgi:hypothetical protein